MRKLIYIILVLVLCVKGLEVFVVQPLVMSEAITKLKKLEPNVQVKSVETSGRDISVKHLTVTAFPDPVDIKGTMAVDLFGKPSVHVDLVPRGSQLWHVDRVLGDVSVWFDQVNLTGGTLVNVYSLDAPTMVVPRVDFSFDHKIKEGRTFINIGIPQLAGGVSGAQLRIKGELICQDDLIGRFTITVVNPLAVLEFLKEVRLLKDKQIMMIKGFIGSAHNQKSEISLPLSFEKGALYLGPIKLYPRSSKDDAFARIIDSEVGSLFRSFGKVLQ
ncbi:MAG: DUF2125 domain-containing protein [Candidatus Paracaedibacteraceae bacterium]|nr:DUF2125 domain-containing protein [Candidatus Paracaedibacteraceae bacterium]